nr:MAG TPA: hypothetical protein [Caudoviricetes sp.]
MVYNNFLLSNSIAFRYPTYLIIIIYNTIFKNNIQSPLRIGWVSFFSLF